MDHLVTLEPAQVSVEPGGEVVCQVRVRNRGTRVDEFVATVLGPAADWVTLEPPSLRLFPPHAAGRAEGADVASKDEGIITMRFRPPRTHLMAPGPVNFAVRVVPVSAGEGSAVVEEGTIEVGRFSEVVAVMVPKRSRGRLSARHRVSVTNRGNVPTSIAFNATDPDNELRFRVVPEQVETGPGGTGHVRVRVKPVRTLFVAPPEFHSFEVGVRPAEAPPLQLQASMEHRRLIPRWLPIGALVLAALLIALLSLRARGAEPVSQAVVPAATPTPAPLTAAAGAPAPAGGGRSVGAKVPPVTATAPAAPAASVPGPCPPPATGGQRSYYAADGNAIDTGGAQRNGTFQNGAGYVPGSIAGPSDQAFSLPADAYVDLGPLPGALGVSDFCISLDVKTVQKSTASLVGNRDAAAPPGHWWDIRMQPTGEPYIDLDNSATGGGTVSLVARNRINDGRWHTIMAIRVGSLVNIYLDGALSGSTSTVKVIDVSNRSSTRIGTDGFVPFVGAIDEVTISHA